MSEFIKALNDGISAATQAVVAQNEINQVFQDLGKQILEHTGGKILITLGFHDLNAATIAPPTSLGMRVVNSILADEPIPEINFNALVALDPRKRDFIPVRLYPPEQHVRTTEFDQLSLSE